MSRKYELLHKDAIDFSAHHGIYKLFRIRALRDFGQVKAGDLGGYIESESNLSHQGNAWVGSGGKVCDNAHVCDDAQVFGWAVAYGDARIRGDAVINYEEVGGKEIIGGQAALPLRHPPAP